MIKSLCCYNKLWHPTSLRMWLSYRLRRWEWQSLTFLVLVKVFFSVACGVMHLSPSHYRLFGRKRVPSFYVNISCYDEDTYSIFFSAANIQVRKWWYLQCCSWLTTRRHQARSLMQSYSTNMQIRKVAEQSRQTTKMIPNQQLPITPMHSRSKDSLIKVRKTLESVHVCNVHVWFHSQDQNWVSGEALKKQSVLKPSWEQWAPRHTAVN